MTTTESFKIFEVLLRHFKNEEMARTIAEEVIAVLETDTGKTIGQLARKEGFYKENQTVKESFYQLEKAVDSLAISLNSGFDRLTIGIVSTGAGATIIIILAYWLLFVK